jgi:hypothetical protein
MPEHRARRRVVFIALCSFAAAALAAAPAPAAQRSLVPAYFYPDWWNAGNAWYRMCDGMSAAGGTPIAVMNPASGPGTAANPDYQQVIGYCHGRGRHVVGYVHTSYGARPLAAVQAEIDATYAFYPAIDGIFLDEMSTDSSTRTYYRALYAYVKAKPGFHDVVGNPGAAAPTSWQLDAPVADQVVVFEGTAATFSRWTPPPWATTRPSQVVHLVHAAAGPTAIIAACARSKALGGGWSYVTDDTLPNPWDTLPAPASWSAEARACA